ncbi:MAG: class I tRNA ligase family protein, partial [Candidatus Micrarchaeia archaeon]
GYGTDFYKKHKVCTLRPQGNDIIRTWLYYTLLKCYLLTKKVIFKDVWINFMIVDEQGRKMAKSLGNVIDPNEIINKYGAEPLRFWAAFEGNLTKQDFRCSFERIEKAQAVIIKLWNVARFISQFIDEIKNLEKETSEGNEENFEKKIVNDLDRLMIKETNKLISFSKKCYLKYDFHNPSIKIRNFLWEIFASNYLEMVKVRVYDKNNEKFSKEERESALLTLSYCIKNILKLLAPIIPFVTYKIFKEFYEKNIHKESFPIGIKLKTKPSFTIKQIIALNSRIWKRKKKLNLPLNAEIEEFKISKNLKSIEKDIQLTHKIKNITYKL